MERITTAGDPIWINFQGTRLSLKKNEAEAIILAEEK
jgi:Fe2+ transport system protein FeoA